jgi:ELWxxDGT repeat protein
MELETEIEYINFNGNIFFSADDGINGIELWKTNGFGLGTTIVKDINSGSDSSNPAELTLVNNSLYFTAYDSTTSAIELFQSDGTNMGTIILSSDVDNPELLTAIGDTLFFSADDTIDNFLNCDIAGYILDDDVLWSSDGTNSGTGIVDNSVYPIQIFSYADLIYVNSRTFEQDWDDSSVGDDGAGEWVCFEEENQLVYYDDTKRIIDSGVGVENVASLDDVLFYIHKSNNLHYHTTNQGEFISLLSE